MANSLQCFDNYIQFFIVGVQFLGCCTVHLIPPIAYSNGLIENRSVRAEKREFDARVQTPMPDLQIFDFDDVHDVFTRNTNIPDNGFRCQHNIRAVYRCIEMLVLSARTHRSDSPHPECTQCFAVWAQHFSFELYQTSLSSFLLTAFTAKSYKCATINDVTTMIHVK